MERLYLDCASAWPLRPEAAAAMRDAEPIAGADPSRRHAEGRAAAQLLDNATATVQRRLGADDVTWTSGGTEAIHLAILGAARAAERRGERRRHVVASAVEHSAVLRACERLRDEHGFDLTVVGVDGSGTVDGAAMAAAIRDDTLLVNLQHANHEVGAIQPTHEASLVCRERGALLHVDACQTVGQLGVTMEQVGADLLSASAGKFGGPAGVGFLALGPRARIDALLLGDERQRRRRAGRLGVPQVAGAAVALEVAAANLDTERSARELVRRRMRERLAELDDVAIHGPLADAHPGIVACSALYVEGEALLVALDDAGVAAHSGSSCATTSGEPSHVLVAMEALTHGHVRASFDPSITTSDADRFVDILAGAVERLRATAGVRR